MIKIISSQPKSRLGRQVIAHSKWATVYKDKVLSNGGHKLEYWCVDRSDSVIVLARQKNAFLLTDPQYRPGVDLKTLDFPGGRLDALEPQQAADVALRRELQLPESVPLQFTLLTRRPLIVDSAFSSQKLYGYTVEIPAGIQVEAKQYHENELLNKLQCLQCRALLLEWRAASGYNMLGTSAASSR